MKLIIFIAALLSSNLALAQGISSIARIMGDESLYSRNGRPIMIKNFATTNKPKYRFLIQSGTHGNETLPVEFVQWLSKRFANQTSLLNTLPSDSVSIDFLPIANPDGFALRQRGNAQGVNLNRNFGILWGLSREFAGTSSFSEPETNAVKKLLEAKRYTAAVDVHGYVNWLVAPSSPEQVKQDDPHKIKLYANWLAALNQEIEIQKDYELKTAGALGDGGAFEDFAFWQTGTMAFCLEMNYALPEPNTFERYEALIYRMFSRAIKIQKTSTTIVSNIK